METDIVGFEPEEIRTGEPTRAARLKWVIVLDAALPPGLAANAAALVAATTAAEVPGLIGPAGKDAAGAVHPGLAWAGCSVLAADAAALTALRPRAAETPGVYVADAPTAAQTTRVYDEYLRVIGETDTGDIAYLGISLVGPRARIDKLVKRLPLLS